MATESLSRQGLGARASQLAVTDGVKVPERITVYFWVIKILTTGMGEATSDFLAHKFSPVIAGAIGGLFFAGAMLVQFATRKYNAWAYWFAVSMVAVFGTMAADGLHIELGIKYQYSTTFYLIVLAVVLVAWHKSERTLSIHSIYTARREGFYWATVLATFALGTATGDLTATTLHLGWFSSGLLFTGLIALPALAFLLLKANDILAFWVAYILTRPLGASFADWMGLPRHLGGLNMGRGVVALVLAAPIVILVVYVARSRVDMDPEMGKGQLRTSQLRTK